MKQPARNYVALSITTNTAGRHYIAGFRFVEILPFSYINKFKSLSKSLIHVLFFSTIPIVAYLKKKRDKYTKTSITKTSVFILCPLTILPWMSIRNSPFCIR